jgi:hypothetical protein
MTVARQELEHELAAMRGKLEEEVFTLRNDLHTKEEAIAQLKKGVDYHESKAWRLETKLAQKNQFVPLGENKDNAGVPTNLAGIHRPGIEGQANRFIRALEDFYVAQSLQTKEAPLRRRCFPYMQPSHSRNKSSSIEQDSIRRTPLLNQTLGDGQSGSVVQFSPSLTNF